MDLNMGIHTENSERCNNVLLSDFGWVRLDGHVARVLLVVRQNLVVIVVVNNSNQQQQHREG